METCTYLRLARWQGKAGQGDVGTRRGRKPGVEAQHVGARVAAGGTASSSPRQVLQEDG